MSGSGVRGAALAAFVTALVVAVLAAVRRGGAVGPGRAVTATLAAACVAAGAAFVPLPPYGHRHEVVRGHRVEPPETDPLSRLPQWAAKPRRTVLHARFAEAPGDAARLWPVLAYDTYAPATGWRAAPALTPLPRAADGATVEVRLAHPERLVPHPFGVRAASPAGTRLDRRAEALRTPLAGTSYTLTFAAPAPPTGGPVAVPAVTACADPELRSLVARVNDEGTLAERLARLEQFLSATAVPDTTAPPGDGCAAVATALRAGRGTGDQIATAFALAARMLGASSRVVAGFAPRRAVGKDGRLDVLGGDAAAWPQVAFAGGAWVDYWPRPERAAGGHKSQMGGATGGASRSPGPHPPKDRHASAWWPRLLVAVGVLTVAAAGLLALWLRRRRGGPGEPSAESPRDPRQDVLASWQRALRATGHPVGAATTAREVATGTDVPPLRDLAALVDSVLYVPPARASEADAERAADLADRAAAGAARSRSERADREQESRLSRWPRH